jgi:hypothetical protein
MKPYPLVEDLVRPALRVAMPRAPRLVAPGSTMHLVARCNNREFSFTTPGAKGTGHLSRAKSRISLERGFNSLSTSTG